MPSIVSTGCARRGCRRLEHCPPCPVAHAALLTPKNSDSGPLTMPADVLAPRVVLQELAQRQVDHMIKRPLIPPDRLRFKDRDLKRLSGRKAASARRQEHGDMIFQDLVP